jgi:NADPH:quinone reductase-like Zn-dependent oxidoreductase
MTRKGLSLTVSFPRILGIECVGDRVVSYSTSQSIRTDRTGYDQEAGKKELLFRNGADHVLIDECSLSGKLREIFPQGVDKVLELVSTSTLRDSLLRASKGGIVCMTGMLSETWSISDFVPMDYIPAKFCLTIFDSEQIKMEIHRFQSFIRYVESGRIRLQVSRTFSLDQIATAHQLTDSNTAGGKLVVIN